MKLLVVGGAGFIGTIVRPVLEANYDCLHFDRREVPGAEGRCITADVNDDHAVRRAVAHADAVLYLAMGTNERGDVEDIDAAFNVNVCGAYRFLRHALRVGIRRFIYTSSMSVYERLWGQTIVDESVPPDRWDTYGMSKRLGEEVCMAAGQEYPQAVILALRLMFPKNEAQWQEMKAMPARKIWPGSTHPDDLRTLFLAALNCDKPGVHIVQTTGDVPGDHYPNTRATALFGWKPVMRVDAAR